MSAPLFLLASFGVAPVGACPYGESSPTPSAVVDASAATHCASATLLVGSSCSYSTGVMARRVMEQGAEWKGTEKLLQVTDLLESQVAAPFALASDPTWRVVANELVQLLSEGGHLGDSLELSGRWLEVAGVRYVVLTSYKVVNG